MAALHVWGRNVSSLALPMLVGRRVVEQVFVSGPKRCALLERIEMRFGGEVQALQRTNADSRVGVHESTTASQVHRNVSQC